MVLPLKKKENLIFVSFQNREKLRQVITILVSVAVQTIFDDDDLFQIRHVARKFTQFGLTGKKMVRAKVGQFDKRLLREMGVLGLIAPELKYWIFFLPGCAKPIFGGKL